MAAETVVAQTIHDQARSNRGRRRPIASVAARARPTGHLPEWWTFRTGGGNLARRLPYAGRMTAEQLISFARGAPSIDIVDVAGLKAAAARAFDTDPAGITAYGTSVGYLPLRKWIADKHNVEPENVIVTNGSLEADAFVFGHFVKPGDAVIVEKPTYDRTLANLRALGAEVHQVTIDADGIDVDELRDLLESGVRPTLAHIIPNFQNPAGVTLSAARRATLLDLAAEYGFTIFEDDPYADIRFRGERLREPAQPGHARCRRARELVHEDRLPRRAGRLPGRPEGLHRDDRQARHQPVHLAGHGDRGDRLPVLRVRRHRRVDQDGVRGARRARQPAGRFVARAHPRRAVHRTGRWLLPVDRAAGGRRRRQGRCRRRPNAVSPWSRAATSCWRAATTRCGSRTRR